MAGMESWIFCFAASMRDCSVENGWMNFLCHWFPTLTKFLFSTFIIIYQWRENIYIHRQPESTEKRFKQFFFLLLHFIIIVTQLHDPILRGVVDAILFCSLRKKVVNGIKIKMLAHILFWKGRKGMDTYEKLFSTQECFVFCFFFSLSLFTYFHQR